MVNDKWLMQAKAAITKLVWKLNNRQNTVIPAEAGIQPN